MGSHNIFYRCPWLPCTLKVRHRWHLLMCSLALCTAMLGQKKQSCIRSNICCKAEMANLIVAPSRGSLPMHAVGRTSWNRASWDSFGRVFLYRMLQHQFEVVTLVKELSEFRRDQIGLSWHWPRAPFCSLTITGPKTRSAHWAWHQSSMVMQVTCRLCPTGSRMHRLHSYMFQWGSCRTPQGQAPCMADTAVTAVAWRWVSEVSDMHPSQDTLQQGICINISLPCPIIQLKVVIGQTGYPWVTCSIQLGCLLET